MMFFVYILECADKTYYVGCTNNLDKRLKEHNQSKQEEEKPKSRLGKENKNKLYG